MGSETEELKKYVPEERERKVFAKVFDARTVQAVHRLAARGKFDYLEHVISTGKEAHVFRAVTKKKRAGGKEKYVAVKVYKIEASDFKDMNKYVEGDQRFKRVKKDKRELVFAWTSKEFKNFKRAERAGVRVPKPIAFFENVLVMEYIGTDGEAASTLKNYKVRDLELAYDTVIEWMARLMYSVGLIHADLSEYNILVEGVRKEELVLIDIGQGVLNSHPRAQEFFERDARNVANYFKRKRLGVTYEDVLEDIKAWKGKLKGK